MTLTAKKSADITEPGVKAFLIPSWIACQCGYPMINDTYKAGLQNIVVRCKNKKCNIFDVDYVFTLPQAELQKVEYK